MNMIRTTLAGALLLFGTTASAHAATPYVSGSIGIAMRENSDVGEGPASYSLPYDTGYAFAGAIGLKSGKMRVEGEIGYQENGIENADDRKVSMTTYMANGYVDLGLPVSPVTPYLTAGIGLADVKTDGMNFADNSSTVLAGQVGIGAGFSVAPMVTLDAKYRYLIAGDAEFGDDTRIGINSHNVMLGLRVGL
jgi:opacity protein-like surface antigen